MRAHGFIERLREIFVGPEQSGIEQSWITAEALASSSSIEPAQGVRQIIARLEERNSSSVVAGCVQLLGLGHIKDRLGSKWTEVADEAMRIATEALDEHLSAADVYRIVDDGCFQICFDSDDEALAQEQVNRISVAIEKQIAAKAWQINQGVSVDTFVTPVPCERIRDASDPLSALYSSLVEIRDAVNSRAIRRRSIPALRYAGALFQPLWSNRDFGATKNRCLLDTLAGAAATKHLQEIEDLDDLVEALAKVDCVLFAKSIEGLHHAVGDVKRTTIIVPVHFQTLAREQPEFLDLAATLPVQYRRFVLLDLIGVPTATSAGDLLKALKIGRTITDRIIVQMSPNDHRMDQNLRNLIWGVSMNLGEVDSDDPLVARDLVRFTQTATEHGLYSFAYGANTIAKATALVEAGFDYLGGTAVANTVPAPRPHARFKPLFGDVAPRASGADRRAGLREHPRFAPVNPNTTVTFLDGERQDCRIPNVSASGAVVLCRSPVQVGDHLVVGSIPAQVVRTVKHGFAVRFLEVQQTSAVEIALQTPIVGSQLLESLRAIRT